MKGIVEIFLLCHLVTGAPHHQGPGYPEYHPSVPVQQYSQPPQVVCHTTYETLWETSYNDINTQVCTKHYKKDCKIDHRELCVDTYRTVCQKVLETKCHTTYKHVCKEEYKTEYEHYRETDCVTLNQEHCDHRWEGEGNEKIWVVIPGTCVSNPYDVCKDTPKTKEKQVPFHSCETIPVEECLDVPKDECKEVPDMVCQKEPFEICETIPMKTCEEEIRKVPVRFSRKVAKQVCDHSYQKTEVQTLDLAPNALGYTQTNLSPEQPAIGYLQSILDGAKPAPNVARAADLPSVTPFPQLNNLTFTSVFAVPENE